jgi:uncharacterized protein (TIGR03067 family)
MSARWPVAITVGLLAAAWLRAGDAGKELERFTGTWVAVSVERDGTKLPDAEAKKFQLTVKGEKYTFRTGDEVVEGTHKLDPTKKPKQIDAVRSKGPKAGEVIKGIYELDGETFRVCFAAAGKDRPTAFSSKDSGGHRLMVFHRQKE